MRTAGDLYFLVHIKCIFYLKASELISVLILLIISHIEAVCIKHCVETMQSPVDIKTAEVEEDPQLLDQELRWNYLTSRTLLNTGKGWKITADDNHSYLTGGPLAHTYRLLQFHGHWGRCPASGSEHTVDGRGYAGELHFVHWNVDLYDSPRIAMESPKGLAVIAVFLKEGKQNYKLAKITDMLLEVPKPNDECTLPEVINPASLFPDHRDYWTYEGSLTTPNFNESATWIIFKNPIEISHEQLEAFRSMNSIIIESEVDGIPVLTKVAENCREVQDINGRVIRASPVPHI